MPNVCQEPPAAIATQMSNPFTYICCLQSDSWLLDELEPQTPKGTDKCRQNESSKEKSARGKLHIKHVNEQMRLLWLHTRVVQACVSHACDGNLQGWVSQACTTLVCTPLVFA